MTCDEPLSDSSLRQGNARDYVSLLWLLESSPWVYQCRKHENLFDLLVHEPSALYVRRGVIRAALLSSLYRSPIATGHILAVRDQDDIQLAFSTLLPYAEHYLAKQGARWMSFTNGPDWLIQGLSAQGYSLYDKVIVYSKRDWQIHKTGNLEVNVRQALLKDLVALVSLDASVFEPFWRLNTAILQDAIRYATFLLVAELAQEIVGYVLAEHQAVEAFIGRVAVRPSYQRQGIGTRLMVEALSRLKEKGIKTVYLNTQEDNVPSRSLYEGLGFQPTGEYDLIWAKTLPPSPENVNQIVTCC